MADPRTIFSKLKKDNKVESRWCVSHRHDGQMKEWRLLFAPLIKVEVEEETFFSDFAEI